MERRIAVIGLGYVGLPVAVAFARRFTGTIGFDIHAKRVEALAKGQDSTGEIAADDLKKSGLILTSDPAHLKGAGIFIVCVPTPIWPDKRPNLSALESASTLVGRAMGRGAVVCYESTVYPGLTEEFCGPILARSSGLKQGTDFKLGYSPERINPGDREHSFEKIVKVVAGEDPKTTEVLAELYGAVVAAGIFRATSIKVAEAAKVLENTQRDLNIALINEVAIICDLLKIRTRDVLDAAATKWNFLNFSPGLVGGHCIGVDPFYLTSKAQELGYHPEVILAGRRLNDSMGALIARRTVQMLSDCEVPLRQARVGILGITFKENVPDIRNSRVPDIVEGLEAFGVVPLIADPLVTADEVRHEYGIELADISRVTDLDALVLAVPHAAYCSDTNLLLSRLKPNGLLVDVKSALDPSRLPQQVRYWSL